MTAANAEDERLDREDAGADLARQRLDTRPDDAGIHVAVGQRLERRRVVLAREHDLDRVMRAMEVSERLGEAMVDGSRDADASAMVKSYSALRQEVDATRLSRNGQKRGDEASGCPCVPTMYGDDPPTDRLRVREFRASETTGGHLARDGAVRE